MKPLQLLILGLMILPQAVYADTTPVDTKAKNEQKKETKTEKSYWIGVRIAPVPEVLLSQFDAPEADQGLVVVEEVIKDGPAAKAGIKRGDVLLSCSGKKIRHLGDLIETISKTKETPQKLEVVRGGKKQEISVTPEERPRPTTSQGQDLLLGQPSASSRYQAMRFPPEMTIREMENFFRRMQGGLDNENIEYFEENDAFGEAESKRIEFTSKTDKDGKTTVHVTRKTRNGKDVDEKSWDAESVDKLPDEIRGDVKSLIGQ